MTERTQILQGYFETMMMRDMAEHYRIANLQALRYFLKRVMDNVTKPTSINGIYNDLKSQGVKLTKDDLYKWIDYACGIFMFMRVPRYSRSLKKEQSSQDKYYCIDNGLRTAVLLPQSFDNGKNLENAVFLELNRRLLPQDKICYFKDKAECDFVIQRGEKVEQLIQVSWSMSDTLTRTREIKGLVEASKATNCTNLLIITMNEDSEIVQKDLTIKVVRASEWMLGRGKE